jgi:hypothetical protein
VTGTQLNVQRERWRNDIHQFHAQWRPSPHSGCSHEYNHGNFEDESSKISLEREARVERYNAAIDGWRPRPHHIRRPNGGTALTTNHKRPRENDRPNKEEDATQRKAKKSPCVFYFRQGNDCTRGDKCTYDHSEPARLIFDQQERVREAEKAATKRAKEAERQKGGDRGGNGGGRGGRDPYRGNNDRGDRTGDNRSGRGAGDGKYGNGRGR